MRLISQKVPAPRLLSTVVPEVRDRPPERISMRSRLKSVSLFSGNGRAIFVGIFLGAVLLCTISVIYVRIQAALQQAGEGRNLLAVSNHSFTPPTQEVIKISVNQNHDREIYM